ncbi:MAG: 1-deoxy-D-xylulose-5-phosphate reductoisomerase [Geminicoccaceae bacterium]|jgi:1-deoxy-D-xylulose-5-phosphate reductoisomerase|nr:1-deoxy-D-xylulose-5-phosphate reductoisomerase [Geminicoccaceae bacterium]MCB9966554.1 1-deoxy-D-xylulose-5-phosphate reductoisomerase [Geminicoccaceae bacterium]HRY22768.1 1-deoxy-D-xylulose-5-phosphate reductoisomerase [Geminicoccaceae bacterium]
MAASPVHRPPSAAAPRSITVLGATGSVGRSTLALVRADPAAYRVTALVAGSRAAPLAALAREFDARLAVVADPAAYPELRAALAGSGIEAAAGTEAVLEAVIRPVDWVMSAIVGAVGLAPTLEALRRGRMVAIANKECLVSAGGLLLATAKASGAVVLPVDSEHNAMFQALVGHDRAAVERLILTASGGPFRTLDRAAMAKVTVEEALNHPNWSMGAKITIDSATMMNKGLELIEAHHLFGVPEARIEILIHPQSVIHSLVAYRDGSQLAQLGVPDMRVPIAFCLGWPGRLAVEGVQLDLAKVGRLEFAAPDAERFPALRLARDALRSGGTVPAMLNAANEVAVSAFLERRIGFLDIAAVVEQVLMQLPGDEPRTIDDIRECDGVTRRVARSEVARRAAQHA